MARSPANIVINRAPVLTLWAAVVAERLGFDRDAALTIGRTVAGRMATRKAERLGLRKREEGVVAGKRPPDGRDRDVTIMRTTFGMAETERGPRALSRGKPIDPASVRRYLESKFGEDLSAARAAMTALARSRPPKLLAEEAYRLYESFRPSVSPSARGWGAPGPLDLDRIRTLARSGSRSHPTKVIRPRRRNSRVTRDRS